MVVYKHLDVIRDLRTNDIMEITIHYDNNGEIIKYVTKNPYEMETIVRNFEKQTGLARQQLINYNYISEKYRTVQNNQNSMMNNRNHFQEKTKYNQIIRWNNNASIKYGSESNISLSNRGKIKIKPLLLSLLVAGSIGFGIHSINGYKSTYDNHVKTINYDDSNLFFNYDFIDDMFQKLAKGQFGEINAENLDKTIKTIEDLYQSNFNLWNGDFSLKNRDYYGRCYSFSNYYNEDSKEAIMLSYFEKRYNHCVEYYANSLSSSNYAYTQNAITLLCDELYDFVFRNAFLNDKNILYNDLSSHAKLLIIEMFENCAKTVEYKREEHYQIKKDGYKISHSDILRQISVLKEDIIKKLYESIGIDYKNAK